MEALRLGRVRCVRTDNAWRELARVGHVQLSAPAFGRTKVERSRRVRCAFWEKGGGRSSRFVSGASRARTGDLLGAINAPRLRFHLAAVSTVSSQTMLFAQPAETRCVFQTVSIRARSSVPLEAGSRGGSTTRRRNVRPPRRTRLRRGVLVYLRCPWVTIRVGRACGLCGVSDNVSPLSLALAIVRTTEGEFFFALPARPFCASPGAQGPGLSRIYLPESGPARRTRTDGLAGEKGGRARTPRPFDVAALYALTLP